MVSVDEILAGKYPAKAHAEAVVDYIRRAQPDVTDGLIYLGSAKSCLHEDCDQEAPFRQRRPFFYLSGCALPDSAVTYRLASRTLTLYIPPLDPAAVLWSGLPLIPAEAMHKYDVDAVHTTDELGADLASITDAAAAPRLFTIPKQLSSDSLCGDRFRTAGADSNILQEAIDECRTIKDGYEVALIKRANAITADAHHACMRAARTATNERELLATFTAACISRGAPTQAYTGIFGAGRAAATLHYTHNDAPLQGKLNLLLDAGAEVAQYASDVTRTFPLGSAGAFSVESRQIYDLVLRMQRETLAQCRPGAQWEAVHMLAHRVAIDGLLALGILRGGTPDAILARRTSCAFFPHGLGHYLGMDTHDSGGHPDYADPDKLLCYLRKRGPLPVGAVITVEPGIYFCEFIIRPYLQDPAHAQYIDEAVLERYWDVGGVRIEDNVLITPDGYENLTTAIKEVEDMERIINGGGSE